MTAIEVGALVVRTEVISDPLLGDAQVIEHAGKAITVMSAIDWTRPTQIPAVAAPRMLPRGAGSLLMNEIAVRAKRAGVAALRYSGPYPTQALYQSLLRSFRTDATSEQFCGDSLDRALTLDRREIPFDFVPAPFERVLTKHGDADVRDGAVDRATIDGVVFDRDRIAGSLAQLSSLHAQLRVGNLVYAEIAKLDGRGEVVTGPQPIPAFTHAAILGQAFPAELRAQFADVVADQMPRPMVKTVRKIVETTPIVWTDLGARAATFDDAGLQLHAALAALLKPGELGAFIAEVSVHLAHVVQMKIVDVLAKKSAPR